ncbi:hypothetical protein QBC46DRAFT_462142 [Diplogelasinospora grovesii]|uniref:Bulb-type lectin domain-containing protein n=1 Tax=Diplogelasinospora grovesii TaxID=303347 RepID=A0AAN6MZB8_9PEZI|nr:hypothetical protein QBC46DRAFT_462142 [Diplogelasinospora grovesii]
MKSQLLHAVRAHAACISSGNQDTINQLLQSGGADTVVSLCPGTTIPITDSIVFTADGQEISTQGYPADDTRATIIIQPGSNVTSAIRGNWQNHVRVLNIQVDGNRPNAGAFGGDALLEMGGGTDGQTVSHVVAKNTRSWSCMHFIGSGQDDNPCRNANITFNTVGPCGEEGTDANGNGLWADGMSIECVTSTITDNSVTGSTDGGIVIFGSPGSHFLRNTITSSDTYLGFGAINMVDPSYGGNYSNVVVSDNIITGVGNGLFELGIGMGSQIWSNPHPLENFGPTTVTNNIFKGNIGFSIVINGWFGGLTVTGNDASGVHSPSSDTADASQCGAQQQTSFNDNEQLIVYPPGVQGPSTIQAEFTQIPNNGSNWLCLTHPLPTQQSFAPGDLAVRASVSTVVQLRNFHVQIQGDGNLVGIDTTNGVWTVKWASSKYSSNCGSDGSECLIAFGGDGNFVEYDANGPLWDAGTSGTGQLLTFYNAAPWVEVDGAGGAELWTISNLTG